METASNMGTLFYHPDSLSYWRNRKNLPHEPVALDMASRSALANLIRTYTIPKGRGKNCVVELFRRVELDNFFAIPVNGSLAAADYTIQPLR
jgi:hypothetical protein